MSVVDDRGRRILEIAYILILVVVSIQGIIVLSGNAIYEGVRTYVYGVISFSLMVIAAVMGAIAKKSIRLRPFDWYQETREVPFDEYQRMREEYRIQFGKYFDDIDTLSGCCCTMMVPLLVSVMFIADWDGTLGESYWLSVYPLIAVPILFAFLGLISFKVGYYSVRLNFKGFFSKIDDGRYEYLQYLSQLETVQIIAIVDLSRVNGTMKLNSTEWKIISFDLPDTVSIRIEIEDYRFARPYLVATIENGSLPQVQTEVLPMEMACPAIIRYSYLENTLVAECRYDFTSQDCYLAQPDYPDLDYLLREFIGRLSAISFGT